MVAKNQGGEPPLEVIDPAGAVAFLTEICFSADEARAHASEIYQHMVEKSLYLTRGNFTITHPDDLERLFDAYDTHFFDRLFRRLLSSGGHQLSFRFSARMTSAGGKTGRRPLGRSGSPYAFEIAVSTLLLAMGFDGEAPAISVCGIECHDRLEALQRVFEHELIHLLEMLVWGKSSCTARQFAELAGRIFGHTEMTHRMITPREHAAVEHGIRAGDRVSFEFDGERHVGVVNRITRRATVLVESSRGGLYSDGKRYAKYYVPVDTLERMN